MIPYYIGCIMFISVGDINFRYVYGYLAVVLVFLSIIFLYLPSSNKWFRNVALRNAEAMDHIRKVELEMEEQFVVRLSALRS